MEMHGKGTIAVLPGGLSAEQYLTKMNILLTELFVPLTIYSEIEYRSGKASLLLLKKYCFSKKIYGNTPQDASFIEYANTTEKMIDDEIHRMETVNNNIFPVVNFEKLFTIMYNALQLMTSVSLHHGMKKEEKTTKQKAKVVGVELPIMVDVQKTIRWEREDTRIVDVIPYIDKTLGISEAFEKTSNNPNAPKKVIGEWAELKYLSMILELTRIKIEELEVA